MNQKKYEVSMEIAGNAAMWTRPDCGDSPCSYPAPTYSAVKGLFESILWGPAVRIIPTKVELCEVPQFHSYVTNYGGPLRSRDQIKGGESVSVVCDHPHRCLLSPLCRSDPQPTERSASRVGAFLGSEDDVARTCLSADLRAPFEPRTVLRDACARLE